MLRLAPARDEETNREHGDPPVEVPHDHSAVHLMRFADMRWYPLLDDHQSLTMIMSEIMHIIAVKTSFARVVVCEIVLKYVIGSEIDFPCGTPKAS